jgi:hypothetical protein
LHLPHIRRVVAAFGAFNVHGGERPKLLFLFAYDGNKLRRTMLDNFADFRWLSLLTWLFFVAVFGANKHNKGFFSTFGFFRLKT